MTPPEPSAARAKHTKRVCVIGAGSSGIVAVKALRARGLEVVCFEKGSGVGGNWRFGNDNGMSAAYASLHINTSKGRMAYSDFPMPADYPVYAHHSQVLAYFEAYVDRFGLRPCIHFRTTVEHVAREESGWRVTVRDAAGARDERFDAVVVANGHHWKPRLPAFPGQFAGRTLHAHDYKTAESFAGERVLIVGIGNSAVDIACELSKVAKRVVLSTRRSAYVFPKYFFGRPIDTFTTPLSTKLPLGLQAALMHLLLWLHQGDQAKAGVPKPRHALTAAHPTISAELLKVVRAGGVTVRPNVAELSGELVRFEDGAEEPFDTVIYATGYDIAFPFFEPGLLHFEDNDVRLYLRVVPPSLLGLYFVGLVQPLGAVMPLAEAQSEWVARLLTGEVSLPARAEMEREISDYVASLRARYLTSARHTIQVDFYPYLERVRAELSAARR